jgi:hypothetical protein
VLNFVEAAKETIELKSLPIFTSFDCSSENDGSALVECELNRARPEDLPAVRELLNAAILDGDSYPQVRLRAI